MKLLLHLASQSPRRSYLIRKAGYRCRIIESAYQEKHEPDSSPRNLVLKHAHGKLAFANFPKNARFVIAADTVVALHGKIYGKPKNFRDAVNMLFRLSGKKHDVYTGFIVWDALSKRRYFQCVRSRVQIRKMTRAEIRNYFKTMNPLDKAGSYAVQSRPTVVESIQGSYSNVMGLPMEALEKIIKKCSVKKIKKR